MAILDCHTRFFREIFAIPDFLAEPFLTIGFQIIAGKEVPEDFDYEDMKQLLSAKGIGDVTAIDPYDPRADLRYDLNLPVPSEEEERYRTVCDIGTLEHVFDTRRCLENCMRMVKPGGYYFLHTPVRGYFRHGLHTFHPELVTEAFRLNGFEIEYFKYSSRAGDEIQSREDAGAVILWIVGRKTTSMGDFQIPQQSKWAEAYWSGDRVGAPQDSTSQPK